MDKECLRDFFTGKTILVTGATGFLGKLFVEKILRVQPEVKKMYLLLRASNPYSATQRLHNEVFGKELFRVQRDKLGADFSSFISEKVVAVAGDVSQEMLGIKDAKVSEEMLKEINIIVHVAANTKLDERYDIMMATNTMGAFNVLNYARNCRKLEILLHVSTAYVCGQAKGLITEEPFLMGKTLKGSSTLDIDLEKKLIEEKLSELQAQNANEETIKSEMKKFGMIRANLYGWQDTYVFTKAMGEMLVSNMKNNFPLIIARPTVVIGTHAEPFPGWIEKVRTIDYVVYAYGTGRMTSFVGHPETILDTIPADMVINSMIIALVAYYKNLSKNLIYHIGSSLRNPFKLYDLQDIMYCYFTNNPWVHKNGKSVVIAKKLTLYSTTMDGFHQNKESKLESITDLYRPYLLFEGIFDDHNAEKLRMAARTYLDEGFNFDPKNINWKDYMMNTHIPVFVEKILRVQPEVKKMYLLLRASNPYSATQRLHNEVFGKELFRVQRDKLGADFSSFISEKVVAVACDVSQDILGVKDVKMSEEMPKEINIIVHVAANTKLDERYDIMMATNTMGTFNVLNYAKNCRKLEILLHVSTKEPFLMGKTLKGSSTLDIDLEKKLIEGKLSELQAQNANEETIKSVMKKFGMIR